MKSLLFFILIYFSVTGFCQNKPGYHLVDSVNASSLDPSDKVLLDSILPLYHQAKHDTSRLNYLSFLVENTMDETLWPKYNHLMLQLSRKKIEDGGKKVSEFYLKKESDALNNIGFDYINRGEVDSAIFYFNSGLKIQRKINYKKGMASTLSNLGYVYKNKGQLSQALDHYYESLQMSEEAGDDQTAANCYNNIGLIYKNQGDVTKALEYYEKSLSKWLKIGNKQGIAAAYNNLGFIYSGKGDKEKALQYYFKTYELDRQGKDKQGMANSLNNIGLIYKTKGDKIKAEDYFNQSLVLSEEIGNKKGLTESLINLGEIYLTDGKTDKAQKFGERALSLGRELGYPVAISNSADLLSDVYQKLQNWKEAFKMKELHVQMKDSVLNDETQKSVLRQQMKYEYEVQQAVNNANHQKAIAIAAEEKKRQQIVSWAIGVGLVLVLIFSFFLIKRYKLTQQQNKLIEEQKAQVSIAYDQLSEKNKEMVDSIRYAKRIQEAILKEEEHVSLHLPEHFILFKPKDIVSGDFYWSYERDGWWYLAAADCTGHGVPGALLTMLGTSFLNEIVSASNLLTPAEILNRLRSKVVNELRTTRDDDTSNFSIKDGMDISLARFNLSSKTLEWAGANNPLWIARKSGNKLDSLFKTYNEVSKIGWIKISGDKQPIGDYPNPSPFTNNPLQLLSGDTIYLLTDGYADQFGGSQGKKLKYKSLLNQLNELFEMPLPKQKEKLNAYFEEWKGNLEQVDDVTLIGVRI